MEISIQIWRPCSEMWECVIFTLCEIGIRNNNAKEVSNRKYLLFSFWNLWPFCLLLSFNIEVSGPIYVAFNSLRRGGFFISLCPIPRAHGRAWAICPLYQQSSSSQPVAFSDVCKSTLLAAVANINTELSLDITIWAYLFHACIWIVFEKYLKKCLPFGRTRILL